MKSDGRNTKQLRYLILCLDTELDKSIQFRPSYFEIDGCIPLRIECVFTLWVTGRYRSVFNYCEIKVWWCFSSSFFLKQLWAIYELLIFAHFFFPLVNGIIEEVKNPSLVPCSWAEIYLNYAFHLYRFFGLKVLRILTW